MRKTAFFLLFLILFSTLVSPMAVYAQYEPDFSVDAQAAYMVNLETGMVMYEKNAQEHVDPSSLTMIMTAILAYERIEDRDNTMIPLRAYVEDTIYTAGLKVREQGGYLTTCGIYRNESLSVTNLIYAMMLPSGYEAAMMLGDYIGDGSIEYFTQLMNEKAKEIGAINTHFTTSNGLYDPEQYTTAYDMYLIARYAMNLPGFMDIVNTSVYDGGPTESHEQLIWNNTNKLIDKNSTYYYGYISGIKAAVTPESGRSIVTTATKDGYNYMLVLMGTPYQDDQGNVLDTNTAFTQTTDLYKWAFDTFRVKSLMEKGIGVGEVGLAFAQGSKDHLLLMSGDRFTALLPNEIEASSVTIELDVPQVVAAPIERGQQVGQIKLILANEVIGSVPAVSAETVEASALALGVDWFFGLFDSFGAKFALIFTLLLIVAYVILMLLRNRNNRRYASVKRRRHI